MKKMLARFQRQKDEEKKRDEEMKKVGHKTSDTFHNFLMRKAAENNRKMEAESKMKNSKIFDYDKMKKA